MTKTWLTLAALAAFCLAPTAAEQLTVVPSAVAGRQAYVTNKGINWYSSLSQACAQAKHDGKLVFWLHMLGSINGAT